MDRQHIAKGWRAERLERLRARMRERSLDGLIIPRWDAHQSEYCVPADERLAWATGFSGSWGLALVLLDRALLFVDGRYTVQAAQEVDGAFFEHRHLHDEPVHGWLAANARGGEVYGFDPLILTPLIHDQVEAALSERGAALRPVTPSPIDEVWIDRPGPPLAPAFPFPPERSGESSRAKRERLAARLRESRIDLLVDSQPDNLAWLLNLRGSDVPDNPVAQGFMLVDASGGVELFMDERKLGNHSGFELDEVSIRPPDALLGRLAERLRPGERVAVDPKFAPVGAALTAREAGAHAAIEPNPLTALKAIKNPVELAGLRAAARRDSIAWVRFLAWVGEEIAQRKGGAPLTELEAEARILAFREELEQFVGPSFRTISASDANGAMCHYSAPPTGGAPIGSSSLYLLDSGGQYLDGTTDATRTICFDAPTAEWRTAYTLVLKGHIALATLRFPAGTRGYQIDAFARQALWAHGLDYDHGTGHGVGHFLSVHEHPQRIGKDPVMAGLVAGMTITNEPGYYAAGRYGVRIENLCEIVEDGPGFLRLSDLTLVPLDRRLIDAALLDGREIGWIDAYHARVRDELLGLLPDAGVRDWLIENSEPLRH